MSVPIRLQQLSKSFGGVRAVQNVSLELPAGRPTAIIGPNGAGKSTLLKLISGAYRPTSGQVHVGEVRTDRLRPHRVARMGIGVAHQVPRPFRDLTVRRNVEVAVGAAGRAADASEVLERTGLERLEARPAGSLGVLDLKRLEVARALGCRPEVLLLDEVAAGLVGRELDEAIALVRSVSDTGVTVVLVEHVEAVVSQVAERVVVMNWGEVLADGSPAEVAADDRVKEVYLGRRTAVSRSRRVLHSSAHDPALKVCGLSSGHGSQLAVRDLDLRVEAGSIVAVLGANGAGKSSLCATISGILPARTGTISLFGQDVTDRPPHARTAAGIAHCMEGRRLFAELSVQENLVLGAGRHVSRAALRERIADVLEMFPQVQPKLDAPAGSLSGGQQQMVAICRALMSQPRLLLLDEVSLGLSPLVVDEMYAGIEQIRERGTSILLVEQNVERCLDVADHAYVLNRGHISFSGQPSLLTHEGALDVAYFGSVTELATTTTKGGA